MRETLFLREPPCPFDEQRFKGCLTWTDGRLTYYINRRCKAQLLWSFWYNFAQSPYYEDPSLENDYYEKLVSRTHWIAYSETIILKEEDKARRDREHPQGYRQLNERLDFYVTKPEFAQAFGEVWKLGRKQGQQRVQEVVIFKSLHVVLLAGRAFGPKPAALEVAAVHLHPADFI